MLRRPVDPAGRGDRGPKTAVEQRHQQSPFLTRLGRALRQAFGPPQRRCPRCGMLVLRDDDQVAFDHRVYHAECAENLLRLG